MKTNTPSPKRSSIFALLCVGGLILAGFTQMFGQTSTSQLCQRPLTLDVPVVKQLWSTSCCEAVIAMVYSYACPDAPLREQEVIEFAEANG